MPIRKRQILPIFAWCLKILLGIMLVALIVGIVYLYKLSGQYKLSPKWLWSIARDDTSLLKQYQGRTNIVILGIGGANHEGGDLTDTIMVVSVGLKSHDIALISVPRDVWIPTLKDKINSAYHYGEEKAKGGGLILAKSSVEEVVGIPIHYVALIDFSGFKEIIDVVGGIDVEVQDTFTDESYPIAGKENDECAGDLEFKCRYETVTFTKGIEHMNGEQALKYVRSRYAKDENGTDFSRGKRQQAVLVSLKKKILEKQTWTDLNKVKLLYKAIDDATTTDMFLGEALLVARTSGKDIVIRSVGITQDEPQKNKKGLLINPPQWKYDGRWVLIPKQDDNFDKIKAYVECVVKNSLYCESLVN